jgi:hypothetical protein
MTPEYTEISTDYMNQYRELLCKSESRSSEYSFGNIWGWAEHYGLKWRSCGSLCWIKQTFPTHVHWAPVGQWDDFDWAAAFNGRACQNEYKGEYSGNCCEGMSFIRVPEKLLNLWQQVLPPERLQITETRGQWDYLYSPSELATLPGNRFHKKKNLLNQFNKTYDFMYAPMTVDCVESVLEMQEEWNKWREQEDAPVLLAENKAIFRVLSMWDQIPGLTGGAIHLDGNVVAYTVGEKVCADTFVVHFEKGMPSYKGIYQAINNSFTKDIAKNEQIHYVNREQDLDDPGLRKAKESYNPIDYVKKYAVLVLPA